MKQLSFYFLIALCCISIHAKAQSCALDQVGTTTVSPTSTLADMAIDGNNKVYSLAYNGTTKVIELKSATVSSSWTLVATVPTVTNTTVKPALAINKIGEIFAFIRDEPNGKVGKVYKSTGGAFTQVGGPISVGPVSDLSIAFASTNEIYIAYTDVVPSNLATVKRWNGSAWLDVGPGGIASSGASKFNSLIIDNTNTPILAYQDDDMGLATTVSKFNGTSWNPFFTSASGPTSSTTLRCATNGDYYLGYIEGSDASVVQKYDGSSWNQLGFPLTGLSSGSGNYELDIDPANSPYIIAATTSSMVTAYRFDGGTGWLQVPAGFINTNISTMVNIAFDRFGAPYFGYVDVPNNNALNVKTLTSLVSITAQPTSTTLCNGNSGVFSITTAGPGSPSYNWQSNSSSGFADVIVPYSQSTNILNVTANPTVNQDKIRCVVDIGCRNVISNTATLTVVTPSTNLVVTNPTCSGSCNGMITSNPSGGSAPYTFTWTPGGASTQTLSGACAGTYSLITVDANGCSVTASATIIDPIAVTSSISGNMTICNGSNTTLTVTVTGGTGPYTYSWTPGGSLSSTTSSVVIASPSSTQTYTVTATDALSCVATYTVMLTVNAAPVVNGGSNSTICSGGSATLNGSGANTYTWNPGNLTGGTQIVNPISTTVYTVVGTNTLSGCTNTATAIVTVNPLPTANAGPTRSLSCIITSTTLAGSSVGGLTYNWTGPGIVSGGTTLTPTVNLPGVYSLIATSGAGCASLSSNVTVTQNTTAPIPSASTTGTLTCSAATVALNGTPAAGVTYLWSGPSVSGSTTSQNTNANAAGSYTLRVTSATNGCTNTAVTNVTQNTINPTANAGMDQNLTCSSPSVTLSGSASPSTCTPVWTGGVTSGSNSYNATASNAGTYTLTVTDPNNGCTSTDEVSVTANAGIPTITVSISNTLTCLTSTANTSASTSASSPTYLWSGPSVVSGNNTPNAIIDQPGTYTVIVTEIATGCSAFATINASQDISLPNITISSSSSVICSGSSSNLTSNGATSYTWSTSQNTSSISVSPNTTSSFTVSGTGTNGCINSAIATITVNTTPTLAVIGNTNICKGSSSTLTGSGATSYTWSSGASTSSISVSPTVTTTYTLNGDNGNGCSSSMPINVSIIPNKSISGVITSTAGVTTGDVILYKYTIGLSKWDSITIVPFASSYSFTNIDSALYVVRAIPSATNIQVTYGDNAISWQNATIINHGCSNNSSQNIGLVGLETYTAGPGVLTGSIVEEDGFGQRISQEFKPLVPGTPIGGIVVKGGKNPGGQMLVQTITDAAGQYTLTGLPLNTANESYFVFVDIPGLDTNGTYHVVISGSNTVYNGLNFTVDSMHINPIGNITSINSQEAILENNIFVYPNPSRDVVTIKYILNNTSKVSIGLYNSVGEKLQVISPLITEEKGNIEHSINLKEFSNGVYFIKFSINNTDNYIKLIKID